MRPQLREHQLTALGKIHDGCIIRGGVGTGKTITSLAYFWTSVCGAPIDPDGTIPPGNPPNPVDVYVITTARKRNSADWEEEAAPFGISRDPEASVAGIKLTVDSWNNIGKYIDIGGAFFIFDEQRVVGSGEWVKSFIKITKSNRWILLSATPGDTWMDYAPVFVANGFYKNKTDFVRTHVVFNNFSKFPKIDRYVETGRLEKQRRKVVVEMPYERHTIRHVMNTLVEWDKEQYERIAKDRWHIYEDRPIRDVSEFFAVSRKLVNSDISRQAAVMELYEKHKKLIIFYNFDYELEMLRVVSKVIGVETAEWNGHKHEEVPTGDRWLYLVQYSAGAEAWNCTTTDTVVFWSLNYSYRVTEQCKGRVDRLNTPYTNLYYYHLRSASPIDNAIAKALANKETFNERKYRDKWERA